MRRPEADIDPFDMQISIVSETGGSPEEDLSAYAGDGWHLLGQ